MAVPLLLPGAALGAGWVFLGTRNKGVRMVALAVAISWVYDDIVTDDSDFGPADLAVVVAISVAINEVID